MNDTFDFENEGLTFYNKTQLEQDMGHSLDYTKFPNKPPRAG